MKNKWLEIKLDDYEAHMSLPSIMQAQYLSEYFLDVIEKYKPKSLALIGSSGGNGLEKLHHKLIDRIVCVDINRDFLSTARKRYSKSFNEIEFIESDISVDTFSFNSVDLIFVGLVFEYVDIRAAIKNLAQVLNTNGKLITVLQLPNPELPEVSPSPYGRLEILNDLFTFVSIKSFLEICEIYGFDLITKNITRLNSGKEFAEVELKKVNT